MSELKDEPVTVTLTLEEWSSVTFALKEIGDADLSDKISALMSASFWKRNREPINSQP